MFTSSLEMETGTMIGTRLTIRASRMPLTRCHKLELMLHIGRGVLTTARIFLEPKILLPLYTIGMVISRSMQADGCN